uniref:Uncharacterized protein n=1 Tax=Anguilla anguilla TaxID=7936 RepID=A0A0E9RVZ6_ANGAN
MYFFLPVCWLAVYVFSLCLTLALSRCRPRRDWDR